MGEEKFASLSSGLLARKGAAKPAMRRQNFMNPEGDIHDDLGWNDMGHDVPHGVEPEEAARMGNMPMPEVRKQLDRLNEDMDEESGSRTFTVADLESELTEDYEERTITTNSHGGLTPMGAEDAEYEDDPEDETAEPADADMAEIPPGAWARSQETDEDEDEDLYEVEESYDHEDFTDEGEADEEDESEGFEEPVGYEPPAYHPPAFEPPAETGYPLAADAEDSEEPAEVMEPVEASEPEEPVAPPAPPAPFKPIGRPVIVPSISISEDNVPAREKIAFTLRLDKDRHLKLRLASAVTNRSAQRLVTAALDQFLDSIPEVQALADKSSGRKTH